MRLLCSSQMLGFNSGKLLNTHCLTQSRTPLSSGVSMHIEHVEFSSCPFSSTIFGSSTLFVLLVAAAVVILQIMFRN